METINFIAMADGTAEEYHYLQGLWQEDRDRHIVENVLGTLKRLQGPTQGYKVDRYEHSLQTATRALRDEASEELVVAALLHDVGDILAPDNHSQLAASMLWPFVGEETHWIVQHHGVFQGYYFWHHWGADRDARERYRGHPHFQACADFCEKYDQSSFDPDYDTLPLETFEPMVRRVFERPVQTFQR